jgi:hypothetical protein
MPHLQRPINANQRTGPRRACAKHPDAPTTRTDTYPGLQQDVARVRQRHVEFGSIPTGHKTDRPRTCCENSPAAATRRAQPFQSESRRPGVFPVAAQHLPERRQQVGRHHPCPRRAAPCRVGRRRPPQPPWRMAFTGGNHGRTPQAGSWRSLPASFFWPSTAGRTACPAAKRSGPAWSDGDRWARRRFQINHLRKWKRLKDFAPNLCGRSMAWRRVAETSAADAHKLGGDACARVSEGLAVMPALAAAVSVTPAVAIRTNMPIGGM